MYAAERCLRTISISLELEGCGRLWRWGGEASVVPCNCALKYIISHTYLDCGASKRARLHIHRANRTRPHTGPEHLLRMARPLGLRYLCLFLYRTLMGRFYHLEI